MRTAKKKILVVVLAVALVLAMSSVAMASGETNSVATTITGAVSSVSTDAITIIGAALGLGVIFWGAKLLRTKFKSMAK